MNLDKNLELLRYDERAHQLLADGKVVKNQNGSQSILECTRAPYLFYEKAHVDLISKASNVLEIGSGTGLHTYSLLNRKAKVYAFDISINSVKYLKNRYKNNINLFSQVADMESLPFNDESFDVVCSAGCLSYGDNTIVRDEIYRVLRDDGVLYLTTPNGESIHFSNNKIKLHELTALLSSFDYDLKGWNWFKPFYLFNNLKVYLNHPKIMCKFEFVWRRLVNDMLCKNIIDVDKAKYFYLEARKIQ